MRIAYTCHDVFPSSSTNTQQVFWTITEFARLGHEVALYVPGVSTPAETDPLVGIAGYYGVPLGDVPRGLTIVSAGAASMKWPGPAGAGLFDWRIPASLERVSHDLVWTRDPLALLACLRAGWPTVFETYRPDFAERSRFGLWRRLCFRHPGFRGVMVHSRLAADAFLLAGVAADRCIVVHNGFAPSLLDPPRSREEARSALGLSMEKPLVVYAGHTGPEKGIGVVIGVAARVPAADFLVVGVDPDSDEARQLDALARAAGARNLIFRRRVPVADVAPYLYAADCLLIPPTDEPLRRFRRTVLPMKVFSYLAAGRPILAPRLPDIEEVLTDGETARLVPPNDVARTAEILTELLGDPSLQERLGRQARIAAEGFTWSARAKRIAAFLGDQPRASGFSSNAAAASSR